LYPQFRASTKAVANQDPWFLVSSSLSLGIEYTLKPLEADFKIGIFRIRVRILPSGGRERGLVASMGTG
jgi:hypothetical protein